MNRVHPLEITTRCKYLASPNSYHAICLAQDLVAAGQKLEITEGVDLEFELLVRIIPDCEEGVWRFVGELELWETCDDEQSLICWERGPATWAHFLVARALAEMVEVYISVATGE